MIEALEHFRPHQEELRKRLIRCCLALLLTSTVAYLFKDEIAAWCMRPLYQAYPQLGKLVYTKLTDAFLSYLKLSLLVGLAASFPFLLYQAWLFVAPGLLDREKRTVRTVVLWATLLFAGGLIPEIADDPASVDNGMKWGYNWTIGPFELWDMIGVRSSVGSPVM